MAIRRALIKRKVNELLEECGVYSAPVPVEKCARYLKAVIRFEPLEGNVSGLLHFNPNGKAIIGINSFHSESRKRFSIAHEIGHLVLHSEDEENLYVDEEKLSYVAYRNERSSEGSDEKEMEANLFAAELLMPQDILNNDFQEAFNEHIDAEDAIADLASKYQVSIQALTIRLSKLGLVV